MNHRSTHAARFALTGVAFAAACLWGSQALALGLGRLNVTSALGETLRAEIEVTSITADEAASLKLRVAPADAYRAAGVEYNAALSSAQVQLARLSNGRQVLRVTSDRAVLEPFVDVIIEATWASGRLVREYTMLFDPPGTRTAQAPAAPGTAPAITPSAPVPLPVPAPSSAQAPAQPPAVAAAPAPAASPAASPAPAATPRAPAPPRATPVEPTRPPVASAAPARGPGGTVGTAETTEAGREDYRVRAGDSLSRIAGRTQRPGVSLDQMLVSLFRGNPQAFVADNMNRLKSGAVLQVPAAEEAAKLSQQEARDVIVAQSNDFAAYRQRLASGTTTAADETTSRQARGQVQTQVEDRRQGAAPTPDRLQLSQGGLKAASPEARASREAANRDDRSRLAELTRNVDELKRLQGATAPAATPGTPAAPATASTPAAPGAGRTPPAATAAPTPSPAQPTVVAMAPPNPAPTPAPAPAATPAPVVGTPPVVAPSVTAPSVTAPPVAAPPVAAPPVATPVTPPAPPPAPIPPAASASRPGEPPATAPLAAEQPGLLDDLRNNALLLPAVGVLVALLAGLGLYRLRGRMRRPAGETSFLESRLQPDSFFGASGGQRIDTRDATPSTNAAGSSSMSYSLSQLDAIGDVDPVAEADVYLAYGRDLQAEEILKEAMRATPERMAIRGKLLEVYAKRRDTKSYELLASQMFNLTRGEGEDWAKAQVLGLSIDPDNVLYQPGGAPEEVRGAGGQVVAEPLGASTLPYTAPAGAPAFKPAADATLDGGKTGVDSGLDLDLDFDMPGHRTMAMPAPAPQPAASAPMPLGEATMPFNTAEHLATEHDAGHTLDLSLDDLGDAPPASAPATPPSPTRPSAPAAAGHDDGGLDFDLGDLGLPHRPEAQDAVALKTPTQLPAEPGLDFADFSIDGQPVEPPSAGNALGGMDATDSATNGAPKPNSTAEDALARKLELADEFRQIGDTEGARDLLEEVVANGSGALQAKAQGMLDKLR